MAHRGQAAVSALRRRCGDLARAVMDVMHADGSVVFLPSREMAAVEHALGRPCNQNGTRYAEGLVGLPLAALPVTDLLLGDHAAVLHRDDAISLLPGQPEVMALLGIETIGVVASTAHHYDLANPWRAVASFSYTDRLQPDLASVVTVRKLLDADAADIYSLLSRVSA